MSTTAPALSEKTISIVKSTAPVLQEGGEALTRHFYERMFRENPEVSSLFNASNQAGGTQQRALAGAICAFAANVDNLEVLGAAVERIAQKHAGLRILPEHYPIVGSNLLASISEVLSLPDDHEIITAWAEAYGFLADILIGRETQIYRKQESSENGWSGFKNFRIIRKVVESDVIDSFYLAPADDSKVPFYKPGQYITVRVPDSTTGTTMRNYSLSSAHHPDHFRISVKAEPVLGGLILLLVLVIRRKPLWPEARLARWILPLGLLATTLTFGAMFASPAYTGAGIASVLGNTQPLSRGINAAIGAMTTSISHACRAGESGALED